MPESVYVLIAYVIVAVLVGLAGFFLGMFVNRLRSQAQIKQAKDNAGRMLEEAKTKQAELLLVAKDEALRLRTEIENENRERRSELQRQERRLQQKEENLDRKLDTLERLEKALQGKEKEFEQIRQQLDQAREDQIR